MDATTRTDGTANSRFGDRLLPETEHATNENRTQSFALATADKAFWIAATILAGVVIFVFHSLALFFLPAADFLVGALAFGLFHLILRWNGREHTATVALNQYDFWKDMAEKGEAHIHFLSNSLKHARDEIEFLRAWLAVLPGADHVDQDKIVAEVERRREAKREQRKAWAQQAERVELDREVRP